jgi:exosortase sorting signal-containing protein
MNSKAILFFAITLAVSFSAFGDVIITPPAPTTEDLLTITVANFFASPSSYVTSSSISRTGNAFTVEQDVTVVCGPITPPSTAAVIVPPRVGSEFLVGRLPAGVYTVTANIHTTGCTAPAPLPIVQTATFVVLTPIPTLDPTALLVLAVLLAATALVALRR